MSSYTSQLNAYAIPLLHAAKYPASDVCGVLLGKSNEITTAVPFFHHWTTVTPMLEVALQQVDLYAKKNNLIILGWYHANARIDDNNVPERALKVAETIKKNNGDKSLIFMVNNKQLSTLDKDEPAIIPYVYGSDNQLKKLKEPFTEKGDISIVQKDIHGKMRELFSASAYHRIQDFDEHVDDVSINWLDVSKLTL